MSWILQKNCWGFYFLNAAGKTLIFFVNFYNYNFPFSELYATLLSYQKRSQKLYINSQIQILSGSVAFHFLRLVFISYVI